MREVSQKGKGCGEGLGDEVRLGVRDGEEVGEEEGPAGEMLAEGEGLRGGGEAHIV